MSQVRDVFKNFSMLFLAQILTSICGFIWTIIIARYLGVANYGIMGFAISFTGILGITMDFGISTHIVRHISTNHDSAPKYLGNAIPLKSLFSVGSFVLALIILILMKCNELTIIVTLLFTIEKAFMSMNGIFMGTFQAFEVGKYQAIASVVTTSLLLIFILLAVFGDFGLYGISIAYLLANIGVVIYSYLTVRKKAVIPKFEFDKAFCKKITLYSIPFALTGFFSAIYYSIDMIMITNMIGDYPNGIYNAAYKLISVLLVFYSVYGVVVFPIMSRFFKDEKNLLKILFEKSVKYLSLLIIPIAFSTMIYSSDIIFLIYGSKFQAADVCLSILIWTVSLLFINGACTNLLNASHKETSVTIIYIIAAIFNFSVNLYLIPHYSYIGASISTVLSDLLIIILFLYVINKIGELPNRTLLFDLIKIIISSLIVYGALLVLNLSMWVAIPVGIGLYLVLIYLLRLVDDGDKFIVKEILGK